MASTFLRLLALLDFSAVYLIIVNKANKLNKQLIFEYQTTFLQLSATFSFLVKGCYNFNMFIDSPNFVRRRIANSQQPLDHTKQQFMSFGKERQKIFSYVANTLLEHQRDQQILEQFRKEAELIKKRKFQSKRQPKHTSTVSPVKPTTQRPSFPAHPQQRVEEELITPPRVRQQSKSPEFEVVLRHSNELVEKYRKLLSIKEKELKKKERKLESSKLAMHKMSIRMKELERQRKIADRQQEAELQKIEVTLRQMGTQISQNKSSVARQISALKEQLNYSVTQDLPKISQFGASRHQLKENLARMAVPRKQQLQGIKRKVKSLKSNKIERLRSPSVVYTKLPTECSWQAESPRSKGNLENSSNNSIIRQSGFCAF